MRTEQIGDPELEEGEDDEEEDEESQDEEGFKDLLVGSVTV